MTADGNSVARPRLVRRSRRHTVVALLLTVGLSVPLTVWGPFSPHHAAASSFPDCDNNGDPDDPDEYLQCPKPIGGAISPSEAAGGGSPSEFCLACALNNVVHRVTTSTGNFWHTFDDLKISGRGIPLDFGRTYNALSSATDGPLGFGWTTTYTMYLTTDPVTQAVTVHEENGAMVTFALVGSAYSAPPRVAATLARTGSGFTFVRRRTQIFDFDGVGRLVGERDPNRYATVLTRPDAATLVVTDPSGRSLTIAFTGTHITSVTDSATPPRSVFFRYTDGNGNLTEVVDANGGHSLFTYDPAHRMLTMREPNFYSDTTTRPSPVVTNEYDDAGRVTRQTDQLGRATTFGYGTDPLGVSTTTITEPNSVDARGNVTVDMFLGGLLIRETKGQGTADEATWQYVYDPATVGVSTVIDPNGHSWSATYDASGNRTSSVDANQRTTTYTYNVLNKLTTVTDPLKVTTTYSYDVSKFGFNLLRESRPLRDSGGHTVATRTTTYNYFERGDTHPGEVTSMVDPDGKTWLYDYDANGYRRSTTDPMGDQTTTVFNSIGWPTSSVGPRGNVPGCSCASQFTTTFDYTDQRQGGINGFGDVGTVTDPVGQTVPAPAHRTVHTYDANRNVTRVKDGDGNLTTTGYDPANEPITIQRADQTILRNAYDAGGNLHVQSDGLQRPTTKYHDHLNRVSSIVDPLQRSTSYTYDGVGNRLQLKDPQGQIATYSYNMLDQLTGISYDHNHGRDVTNISYDADGQRTSMVDQTGTSAWAWDSLHRLTSSTNGAGATVGYDYRTPSGGYDLKNQVGHITYPVGGTVTHTYDDAGRLRTVDDGLGHTTTLTTDPSSNYTGEQYPNGVTATTTYDPANGIGTVSHAPSGSPNSPFLSFGYTRDGNQQLKTTATTGIPRDNHSYGYSPLNQTTTVDSSQYSYDLADNITGLTNGTSQVYDVANEVTSSPGPISLAATGTGGGVTPFATVSFSPPAAAGDQILVASTESTSATVTGPAGYTLIDTEVSSTTKTVVFRKTATGGESAAIVGVSSGSETVIAAVYRGVDPSTPVDAIAGGAGSGGSVTANPVTTTGTGDQLVLFAGATGGTFGGRWAAVPSMTTRAQLTPTLSSTSGLLADQMIPAAGSTGSRTATFSAVVPVVASLIALKPAPAFTDAYDLRGNRTSKTTPQGQTQYTYDQANRLSTLAAPGLPAAAYMYNGDGLRQNKTVSGATTSYSWDLSQGTPLLLSETTTQGTARYVYGVHGLPIERIAPDNSVLYYHQDQLGSTRALTDASGAVQATYAYDAYGNLCATCKTGPADTPFKFAGQYTDVETGFQYLRARYYDSATAQFLSRDPIVDLTRQAYSYVDNDPLNLADPTGLAETESINGGTEPDCTCTSTNPNAADPSWIPTKEQLASAAAVQDRNGLTAAGRALQKHGDRPGSAFSNPGGKASDINAAGQSVAEEIINSPGATIKTGCNVLYGNYFDVRAPDGRGIRYRTDGTFVGFLEP